MNPSPRTIVLCAAPLLLLVPTLFFCTRQLADFLNQIPNSSSAYAEYGGRVLAGVAALALVTFAVAIILSTARAVGPARLGRAALITLGLAAVTWVVPTFLAVGHLLTEVLCYATAAILWVGGLRACYDAWRSLQAARLDPSPVPPLPPGLPAVTALVMVGALSAVCLSLMLGKLTALGLAHGVD